MKIKVICEYCGKEFLREKSRKTTHCSKRCAGYTRNLKNHVVTNCKHCGKQFTKKRSNKKVHCSKKCSATVSSNKMRLKNVAQFFKDRGCELLEEYKNMDIPVAYRCSCGNVGKVSFGHFKQGLYCNECSSKRRRTFEEVKQFYKERGCELLEKEYKDNETKMKYKCRCGKIVWGVFGNFIRQQGCKNCFTGPNHPKYNHSITIQERQTMRQALPEYKEWRRQVYKKDNYTCQKCKRNRTLNAHHIKNYSSFPDGRFDTNNGITFCKNCHKEFHSKYGKTGNNEQQLKEYLSI
jgi:hypothetical protein